MKKFDWKFFSIIFSIFIMGIISLYSITSHQGFEHGLPIYAKQLVWGVVSFALFFIFSFIDYRFLLRVSYMLYLVILGLLISVFFFGTTGMGAQRWIFFGGLSFQPSEVAKISLILVLARYFAYIKKKGFMNFLTLAVPIGMTLLYLGLVLKQPDLGTALVILCIFVSIIFIVGFRFKYMGLITLIGMLVLPFIGELIWGHLKDYQRKRILMFINPSSDPLGSGYHILQSKISIGSGGLTGKGFFGGTQTQLKFLPEGHTDFIFAAFSEEWGFVGVVVLLSLYLILLLYLMDVALKSKDISGMILAYGIVVMLSFHIIVNIGMTLAVLPVVGVPLPLMSYGGTFLVTTMISLGIIHNIKMKRFELRF